MAMQLRDGRVVRAYQVPLFEQAFPLGPVDKAGAVATPTAPANPNISLDERYIAWRAVGDAVWQPHSGGSALHNDGAQLRLGSPHAASLTGDTYIAGGLITPNNLDSFADGAASEDSANHEATWDRRRYRQSLATQLVNLRSETGSSFENTEPAPSESDEPQPVLKHDDAQTSPDLSLGSVLSNGPPLRRRLAEANIRGQARSIIETASNTLTILVLVALSTIGLLLDPKNQSAQALSLSQTNTDGLAGRSIVATPARSIAPEYNSRNANTVDLIASTPSAAAKPDEAAPMLKVLPKVVLNRKKHRSTENSFDVDEKRSPGSSKQDLFLATSIQLSQLAAPVRNAEPFQPTIREPMPPSTVEDGHVEDEGRPKMFNTQPAPPPEMFRDQGSIEKPQDEGVPVAKPTSSIQRAAKSSRRNAAKKRAKSQRTPATAKTTVAPNRPELRFADFCPSTQHRSQSPCSFWPFDIGSMFCPLVVEDLKPCNERPNRQVSRPTPKKAQPYVSVHDIIMAALIAP